MELNLKIFNNLEDYKGYVNKYQMIKTTSGVKVTKFKNIFLTYFSFCILILSLFVIRHYFTYLKYSFVKIKKKFLKPIVKLSKRLKEQLIVNQWQLNK
jgi:hypothetical protein